MNGHQHGNNAALSRCVAWLLRRAADAWQAGFLDDAERLCAGAWRIVDGREYIDADYDVDRNGQGTTNGGMS